MWVQLNKFYKFGPGKIRLGKMLQLKMNYYHKCPIFYDYLICNTLYQCDIGENGQLLDCNNRKLVISVAGFEREHTLLLFFHPVDGGPANGLVGEISL